MDWAACGAFANGYMPELLNHDEFQPDEPPGCDAVMVGGGAERYDGANGRILEHAKLHEIPALMVEFSWLRPAHVYIYLGTPPWLPPSQAVDASRRIDQGLIQKRQPRGETILVVGQRPDLDEQLEPAVATMAATSDRLIHYRKHPNAKRFDPAGRGYMMPGAHTYSDEFDIPSAQPSLQEDLDNAWVVVTHSSGVGHDALLRGIPVMATRSASYWRLASSLDMAAAVDEMTGAPPAERYFDRLAWAHWSHLELRDGSAFNFYRTMWE